MTREERGGTRKTGYRAGGVALLTAALCLADAAHAQWRGAEPAWAGRPAPEGSGAANDGRYGIRLAPLTPRGDAFPARAGFGGFAESEAGGNRPRLDLGGGPSFADRSSGPGVGLRTHGPAARGDGDRRWGASGALRMAPDARGRGLSLSFLPWWADDVDEAQRPWPPGSASLLARENDTGLEAEVGYGLDAFDGRGVLTPYVGVSEAGGGREIRGGVRISFSAIQGAISGATERSAAREVPVPEPPANEVRAPDRTDPAVPPAAPRVADGPRYRVQLGAFSRPAAARRARTALAGALENVLAGGGRGLVVDASGSDGLSRVVLSGSFAGRRAATAVCAGIAARGRDCYVARVRQRERGP